MAGEPPIAVVGAGLAGCEIAWQLGSRGIPVTLFEMRPTVMTPAHQTGRFAELVCSNSLKSKELTTAHGLLKTEMKLAGSLIIDIAERFAVPAGAALAVDRCLFAAAVESRVRDCRHITCQSAEIRRIDELRRSFSRLVIATGPLSSDAISHSLQDLLDDQGLFFYDAIAPTVLSESIDRDIAFRASRYDKGDADYLNCPMSREEYEAFVFSVIRSEKVPFRDFEEGRHFEGCLPLEVMAERGRDTIAFGPMKPVGLTDPRTGRQPWAVLQLRQEDTAGQLFNLVGCQTRMTWGEQKRIFRQVPGLESCEFARMGSMHRNTYVNAPLHLNANLTLKKDNAIYLAGQLTGVEGYVESASMGLWAAMNIIADIRQLDAPPVDPQTMIGALVHYLVSASPMRFQPMNSNFGLLALQGGESSGRSRKERRLQAAENALARWRALLQRLNW